MSKNKKKLGRNDPCPCGSGEKFKKCHMIRQNEKPVTEGEVIGAMGKIGRAKLCHHPRAKEGECDKRIINAHTIQKSGSLKKIARDGHVYSFKPEIATLFKNKGKLVAKLVGINQASTFTGFCSHHDKVTFAPVEDDDFESNEYHATLLGFRAVCREVYTKESQYDTVPFLKKMDKGKHPAMQVMHQNFVKEYKASIELGMRDVRALKAKYDDIIISEDYSDVKYFVIRIKNIPEVVCSGAIIPEYSFSGELLQDLADQAVDLDQLSFNLIATSTGGAIIFNWIGTCLNNDKFVKSLVELQPSEIGNAIIKFCFEYFENVFLSPDWWESLPEPQKNSLSELIFCGITTDHAGRSHKIGGDVFANWDIEAFQTNLSI
jgi:hypothetical protein